MAVKRICAGYNIDTLDDLQWLKACHAELVSLDEAHFAAQRDLFNWQQKAEWDRRRDNLRKYTAKYEETIRLAFLDETARRRRLLNLYTTYKMHELSGCGPFSYGEIALHPEQLDAPLDPAELRLPVEPLPVHELDFFKEPVRKRIRELQMKVEHLEAWRLKILSASQCQPVLLENGQWLYQGSTYKVSGPYSDDEQSLLILDFVEVERRRMERRKRKHSGEMSGDPIG